MDTNLTTKARITPATVTSSNINENKLQDYLNGNFLRYLKEDKNQALKSFLPDVTRYIFTELNSVIKSLESKDLKERSNNHFDESAFEELAKYAYRVKELARNHNKNKPISPDSILKFCDQFLQKLSAVKDIKEELYNDEIFQNPKQLVGIIKSLAIKQCDMYEFSPDVIVVKALNYKPNICCGSGQHLGMLIQELVSNSLKHGLKDVENPKIKIYLETKGTNLILTVQDNGIGLPPIINYGEGVKHILHVVNKVYKGRIKYGNYSYGLKVKIEIPLQNIFDKKNCLHIAA